MSEPVPSPPESIPSVERVWDRFLSEQDRAHLAALPPRPPFGVGRAAAVLAIDNYRWAVGDEPLPLLESIRCWPGSTGMAGWEALANIKVLLTRARAVGVPIIHITGLSQSESGLPPCAAARPSLSPTDSGLSSDLSGAPTVIDTDAVDRLARRFDIVEQAVPQRGEAVFNKTAAGAFFGTPLLAHLTGLGVDTLIVCGAGTSGSIRATVTEGHAQRFKMIVVEECVYDRHEASHAINLFDMSQKYADVLSLVDVTPVLATCASALAHSNQ